MSLLLGRRNTTSDRVDDDLSAEINTPPLRARFDLHADPVILDSSPSSRTDGLTPVGGKQSSFITQNHDQTGLVSSSVLLVRVILIIKSVPILPDPIMQPGFWIEPP
jgi:hypothetical protein